MNSNQQNAVNQLVAAFRDYRGLDARYQAHIAVDGKAHVQFDLPNFPLIVIGASGKPDMPKVPTYSESNGYTALDACLWGDEHLATHKPTTVAKAHPPTGIAPVWSRGGRGARTAAPPVPMEPAPDIHHAGSAGTQGSWQWCAEDYLKNIWWPQDRELMREFSGAVTCAMLHKLCVSYDVHRTIPGHIADLGLEKYQQFVDMLNGHRDTVMTRETVPDIIEQELVNMKKAYGSTFLSAITKAFWMMKQHPVAIYDSYAREGLRLRRLSPRYPSYVVYYGAWFAFFEHRDTQDGLNDALSGLPESPFVRNLLNNGELADSELKSLSESMWFRNRVADRRLIYEGGLINFT